MHDIITDIQTWIERNEPFALATVIQTWGSSPRGTGSTMAVTADMKVAGSVSGGCIEAAVIDEAIRVIPSGAAKELSFGVTDETAWSVGLSCGGTVKVFIERHPAFSESAIEVAIWRELSCALADNRPAVLLTRLSPENPTHLLAYPDGSVTGDWGSLTEAAVHCALDCYARRSNEVAEIAGEAVFNRVFPRKDELIIIGAGHITIHLVRLASDLNFNSVVIDPRRVFAAPERFPVRPTLLTDEWPESVLSERQLTEDTYALLLTHDPKIDDPALHILLRSPVAYIGALGSRKTHARRCERLREAGFRDAEIARISGPAGLAIGAKSPAEIAISMMAEVVKVKHEP